MSNKDKVLLVILIVAGIIAGGYKLLIEPEQIKTAELEAILLQKEEEQRQLQLEIAILPTILEELEQNKALLALEEIKFGGFLNEEDADQYIIDVLNELNLWVLSFEVDPEEKNSLSGEGINILTTRQIAVQCAGSVASAIDFYQTVTDRTDMILEEYGYSLLNVTTLINSYNAANNSNALVATDLEDFDIEMQLSFTITVCTKLEPVPEVEEEIDEAEEQTE